MGVTRGTGSDSGPASNIVFSMALQGASDVLKAIFSGDFVGANESIAAQPEAVDEIFSVFGQAPTSTIPPGCLVFHAVVGMLSKGFTASTSRLVASLCSESCRDQNSSMIVAVLSLMVSSSFEQEDQRVELLEMFPQESLASVDEEGFTFLHLAAAMLHADSKFGPFITAAPPGILSWRDKSGRTAHDLAAACGYPAEVLAMLTVPTKAAGCS